jgi:hypothetical protein
MGVLGALPPGLRGYVAGQDMNAQRQAQEMQGILGIQGALMRQQEFQQQQQMAPLRQKMLEAQMQELTRKGENEQTMLAALQSDPRLANNPLLMAAARSNPGAVLPHIMPKPKSEMTVAPGHTVLDENRNPLYTAPHLPKEPTPSELQRLMRERDALPPNDPNRKLYDQKINKLTTRDAPMSVNLFAPQAGIDPQGNPVFFQPGKQGGAPQIVPGVRPMQDPAGMTPENAGKVSMSTQAIQGVDEFRKRIFGPNGQLKRGTLAAIHTPGAAGMPGNEDARIAYSAIRNAVEAKLRMETGAAATEAEVRRTLDRFLPTPFDTKESAEFKLNTLQDFFKGSLSNTKGVRGAPAPSGNNDPLGIR